MSEVKKLKKVNYKDMEKYKDLAISLWKEYNGEVALERAYFFAALEMLNSMEMLNGDIRFEHRILAINAIPEE